MPSQFEALSGPVLDFLLSDRKDKTLRIIVLGCSNGAEAYTIASILKNRHPDFRFTIHAYDIDEGMINKAKGASYAPDEVFNNKVITSVFVKTTFDIEKNCYIIKQGIQEHVCFDVANALDPNLKEINGTSDIVYAQNFLVHMKPKIAIKAFKNICLLLNPKAALFIDGMDVGMRQKLTRVNKLVPLKYKIEKIHNEARRARGVGWPYAYWGLEQFSTSQKRWQRRYSTVFLRG